MKNVKWKPLIASLVVSLGAGAIAAALTSDSMQQYKNLYKPPLSPPGWIFPVVWTILFILMGAAAYLVYLSEEEGKQQALLLYGIQLVVNIVWSLIFFRLQAYLLAFTWLLLLWYLILMTMKEFYRIDEKAGKLLILYFLWVTFAGYLNLAIALAYM